MSGPSWAVASLCRVHMVTRLNPIGAFFKIIKTRYMILVYLMTLSGQLKVQWDSPTDSSYKKLYSILPAALLSALKELNQAGEHGVIEWEERKKYFSVGFSSIRSHLGQFNGTNFLTIPSSARLSSAAGLLSTVQPQLEGPWRSMYLVRICTILDFCLLLFQLLIPCYAFWLTM